MEDGIPLVQCLAWPVFLGIFLFLARRQVLAVLKSIQKRIERGDPFQAGPSGITFGQSEPKLTRIGETLEPSGEAAAGVLGAGDAAHDSLARYNQVVYLVHQVTPPRRDTDGVDRRGVRIMVDADSDEMLDEIERVVYDLHPTFPQPDREVRDRTSSFALQTRAWGEFNLSADGYFKRHREPLALNRYLNF